MRQIRKTGVLLLALGALWGAGAAVAAERPIEEFVAAQGTYYPMSFVAWLDPATGRGVSVDYAGIYDQWLESASGGTIDLGTTFAGSVQERPLPDGRAEVHVILHSWNALTYGYDPALGLVFGHYSGDVLAGMDAALGHSTLKVTFLNPAPGAALPDLNQLLNDPLPGMELVGIWFRASAEGTIREAFGVPDGTPGRLQVVQNGLHFANSKSKNWDGWPSEHIHIFPIGGE
jgi:hypothetical protein